MIKADKHLILNLTWQSLWRRIESRLGLRWTKNIWTTPAKNWSTLLWLTSRTKKTRSRVTKKWCCRCHWTTIPKNRGRGISTENRTRVFHWWRPHSSKLRCPQWKGSWGEDWRHSWQIFFVVDSSINFFQLIRWVHKLLKGRRENKYKIVFLLYHYSGQA